MRRENLRQSNAPVALRIWVDVHDTTTAIEEAISAVCTSLVQTCNWPRITRTTRAIAKELVITKSSFASTYVEPVPWAVESILILLHDGHAVRFVSRSGDEARTASSRVLEGFGLDEIPQIAIGRERYKSEYLETLPDLERPHVVLDNKWREVERLISLVPFVFHLDRSTAPSLESDLSFEPPELIPWSNEPITLTSWQQFLDVVEDVVAITETEYDGDPDLLFDPKVCDTHPSRRRVTRSGPPPSFLVGDKLKYTG